MHIYNWYHTSLQAFYYVHETRMDMYMNIPLAFSPLAPLFSPLQLTWNPPCCDRIRPPRSQVARKLTLLFPSPGSYTPLPKIPTPQGFPDPNIHSLERHCEPNPQSSLTSILQPCNICMYRCCRCSCLWCMYVVIYKCMRTWDFGSHAQI